jgi:cell division protein FtsB
VSTRAPKPFRSRHILAIAALLGALGTVSYHLQARSGLGRALQLRADVKALRTDNELLRAGNARLRREAEALRWDVRAIEHVARVELGWVRPGEVIVSLDSESKPGAQVQRRSP